MDWIKVKAEHISSEYSDAQVGALVRFQLLVGRLKRVPTDKELFKEVSKKNWTSTVVVMSSFGVDPDLIASKVLEDVEFVEKKRVSSRKTSRDYRSKQKAGDVSRDNHGDGTEEIREDKSIEDEKESIKESIKEEGFNKCKHTLLINEFRIAFKNVFNKWPADRRGSRQDMFAAMDKIIKSMDIPDTTKFYAATENYLESPVVKRDKYIKGFCKWVMEWENWVDYKPQVKASTPFDRAMERLVS